MSKISSSVYTTVAVVVIFLIVSVIILAVALPLSLATQSPDSYIEPPPKKLDNNDSLHNSNPNNPSDQKYSEAPSCRNDLDCRQYRSNNFCDPSSKKCVCGTNIDKCGGTTPYCLPAAYGTCVQCIDWADCPPGSKCNNNEVCEETIIHCTASNTCPYGYYCTSTDGKCHQQCRTTSDCDTLNGQTCDQQYGICTLNECSSNANCSIGYYCDTNTRRCAPYSKCTDNSQCYNNYHCDATTGTCVKNTDSPECQADSECSGGYYCDGVSGSCKKIVNTPYPPVGECSSDTDCRNGYYCDSLSGQCIEGTPPPHKNCTVDRDCAFGEYCSNLDGACHPKFHQKNCKNDGDCSHGYHCTENGFCVKKECIQDLDCPTSKMCGDDGVCFSQSCTLDVDCYGDGSSTDYICSPDTKTCSREGVGIVKPPPLGCSSNADCSRQLPGYYCDTKASACTNVCSVDSDCAAGGNCVNGTCLSCAKDSDCKKSGYSCKNDGDSSGVGTCYPNKPETTCQSNSDCKSSVGDSYYCNSTGECSNTCNIKAPANESVCPPGHYCRPADCKNNADDCGKQYVCTDQCGGADDISSCPSGYECRADLTQNSPSSNNTYKCTKVGTNTDEDGLGAGAIFGIVFAGIAILAAVFAFLLVFFKSDDNTTEVANSELNEGENEVYKYNKHLW